MNLPIQYSDKPVTPFGGMAVMKRFIDQVGIREYLGELDLPEPGSNRGYTSAEILESFWLNIWTGASRYTHCNWLRRDEVIKDISASARCLRRARIVSFLENSAKHGTRLFFQNSSNGFSDK
jgi:hypothetical protein